MDVARKPGTNVLASYESVREILNNNIGKFHPNIEAIIIDDESISINQRIGAAENTVITAIILVMIIEIIHWLLCNSSI